MDRGKKNREGHKVEKKIENLRTIIHPKFEIIFHSLDLLNQKPKKKKIDDNIGNIRHKHFTLLIHRSIIGWIVKRKIGKDAVGNSRTCPLETSRASPSSPTRSVSEVLRKSRGDSWICWRRRTPIPGRGSPNPPRSLGCVFCIRRRRSGLVWVTKCTRRGGRMR